MRGTPSTYFNPSYISTDVGSALEHYGTLSHQVVLYFTLYITSLLALAFTLLSKEIKISLVRDKNRLIVLILLLVGIPPLPSFFTKIALLTTIANSTY
jgi:hypothetical protein